MYMYSMCIISITHSTLARSYWYSQKPPPLNKKRKQPLKKRPHTTPSSSRRARAVSYQNVHHGLADDSQLVLQSSTLLKAWTHACHPPAGCGPLLHKHTHTDTMGMQGCTGTNTYADTEEEKRERKGQCLFQMHWVWESRVSRTCTHSQLTLHTIKIFWTSS